MTWRRTLLLLGCCFLAASSSLAQAPRAPPDGRQLAAIEEFTKQEMARQRVPGLELGIYSRGRICSRKAMASRAWSSTSSSKPTR